MAHFFIINTGGTIGMADTPTGLAPESGLLKATLLGDPRLAGWQEHTLSWYEWQPLIDSSNIRPGHWYELRDQILNADCDGVLIIHGTDTLAYSAAALSFLLAGTGKTVVITGSMRPLAHANSDGFSNLSVALEILTRQQPEVFVAFNGRTLPASRVSKVDTAADSAFMTPNWSDNLWSQPPGRPVTDLTRQWRPSALGVQTLFPGMPMDGLMSMVERNYRALVLNTYGSGNVMTDSALERILDKASQQSIPVFVRSQCLFGEVHLGQYAASNLLSQVGAIACGSMPLEAVLAKLQILCSQFNHASEVIDGFNQPWAREWQSL
jgi:L-asparaginase